MRARKSVCLDCFAALAMTLFLVQSAFALTDEQKKEIGDEAKNFQYNIVTTKSGLQYRVPEDMPIEKRGGIEAPIPFDEYSYSKFKKIDARLQNIEDSLARIEKTIASLTPPEEKKLKA